MAKTIAASRKAAKKKTAPPPPPAAIDDDDDDEIELELETAARPIDAEAELAHVLAELGGLSDATITVTKVSTQGEERLGKYMAREFDVDSLRDRYGGGVYWLYAHAGGKLMTKKRVVFARSLEEQRGGEGRVLSGVSSSSSSGGGDLKEVLAEMARQHQSMLQTVLNVVTQNRAPAMDFSQVIDAATKLSSLGGNKRNDVDVLLQGIKLAREFGRDAGEPGLAGIAMEFLQTMRESLHTSPPARHLTGPVEGSPENMMILIQRALAQQLPVLIRGAQSESDPAVYAQLILDQLPQIYLEPLLSQLNKPEWFALLVKVDGRVVPLQAWFEALRNEIVQATSPKEPSVG